MKESRHASLDIQQLETLTYAAALQALAALRVYDVPMDQQWIVSGDTTFGSASSLHLFPQYNYVARPHIDEVSQTEAIATLATHLRSHHIPVSKGDYVEPVDEIEWRRDICHELVYRPLLYTLLRAGIGTIIDKKEVTPWSLESEDLRMFVRRRIDELEDDLLDRELIVAVCPLQGVLLPEEGMIVDFGEGITLQRWSNRERCIFASICYMLYPWDDMKSLRWQEHVAEITFMREQQQILTSERRPLHEWIFQPSINQRDIELLIGKLDLLKWSLFAAGEQKLFSEGTSLLLSRTRNYLGRVRRDETYVSSAVLLSPSLVDTCRTDISMFSSIAPTCPDLSRALWHFGRSYISPLERDMLLEAAIGIDALLVLGGGDSNYRFCLHGTALLSIIEQREAENFFKELRDIYSNRSAAAHGGDATQLPQFAKQARYRLAQILLAVCMLHSMQELDAHSERAIAKVIQNYILKKVAKRPPLLIHKQTIEDKDAPHGNG